MSQLVGIAGEQPPKTKPFWGMVETAGYRIPSIALAAVRVFYPFYIRLVHSDNPLIPAHCHQGWVRGLLLVGFGFIINACHLHDFLYRLGEGYKQIRGGSDAGSIHDPIQANNPRPLPFEPPEDASWCILPYGQNLVEADRSPFFDVGLDLVAIWERNDDRQPGRCPYDNAVR